MPKPSARTKANRRNGKKGGRPAMPEEDRRVKWDGRLAPETAEKIRDLATAAGISQAGVVDQAVAKVLLVDIRAP